MSLMVLTEVSFAHQGCIYLVKIIIKAIIVEWQSRSIGFYHPYYKLFD